MARTPKIAEDRRDQIMDAALRVFAEKGFSTATNRDIANAAGITPGLIYHYFDSKEALLKEIVDERSASRVIRSLPEQWLALPVKELFRTMALKLLAIVEEEKYVLLMHIYLPEMLHQSDVAPVGIADMQAAGGFLERILASKTESGEIPPTNTALAAEFFLSALVGFVLRRQVFRDPSVLRYSHEQIADSLTEFLLKSLDCS